MPTVIRHAAAKKLVYLSRYQTQREMLDKTKLGIEILGNEALFPTLDQIQPHQIAIT
jgi:hypothetical protein